ncbi:MAG: hypothetical protein ACFCVA_13980 [Gammaproteobacteria bacterium]
MSEKIVVITDQIAFHIDPEGVRGKTYVMYLDETVTAHAIAFFRDQNIPVYDCRHEHSVLAEVLRRVSESEFIKFKEEQLSPSQQQEAILVH